MLIFIILYIAIVQTNPVTKNELNEVNFLSSVQWDQYLPLLAFKEAIDLKGCLLPKEQVQVTESFLFTPTWVLPEVDLSKIQVVANGIGYDAHGTMEINNNLLSFKIDFNYEYNGEKGFGSLLTGPESIDYSINVKQNNKTIKYTLLDCPSIYVDASIYELTVNGLDEMQKVEIANDLNQMNFLPELINQYYLNNAAIFCQELNAFVTEASLPSKISFELDSYAQPSYPSPRIVKTIESIKAQGLHFQKKVYTSGLNIEIFNYQNEFDKPLDYTFYDNHLNSIGISMQLIETYFNYGAENMMFNTILNSTIWPASEFDYQTGDLRKRIPTAYYSFKLATDINVYCLQTAYKFRGLKDTPQENNTINVHLSYDCMARAQSIEFTSFNISLSIDIALDTKHSGQYFNFVVDSYEILKLEFQEIGIFKIWSYDSLKQMVHDGLEENILGYQTYGSGWIRNQLVGKFTYGFTESTLAIWSLQLI